MDMSALIQSQNLRPPGITGSGKGTTVVVSHEVLILPQVPGACQLLLQPQYETSNGGWFCWFGSLTFGIFWNGMRVNLGHYFALNHGYILTLSGPFIFSVWRWQIVKVYDRGFKTSCGGYPWSLRFWRDMGPVSPSPTWVTWHLVLLRIKRTVRFPAAELQNIHNEPHRRVCKEELHHTFHGSIIPAVIRVKTTAPDKKKTGEGSVLTLGCKSEKKHRKNLEYQKNQKNGFWVLTPDAISCQMKHPDWN